MEKRKPFTSERNGKSNILPLGARVPPHSVEAEDSVLGGILLDNDAVFAALERLTADDFYKPAHRVIYAAMVKLSKENAPIDIVSLGNELRAINKLEECGGGDELARLAAGVPSSANVGYYATIVKHAALRRRVIHEASQIASEAFDTECDVEEFLDTAEQRMLSVSEYRSAPSFYKIGDLVHDTIKLVEKRYDAKETVTGVPTGFDDLNDITAGFQPADLIIIAARPSMGKTALALTIAEWVGVHEQRAVAFFSLEMSKEQLVLRLLCSEARVDNKKVRTGHLGERDFPKLVDAASKIAEASIFLDDTPSLSITELRAKARRLHRETPLSLIVVDYLQLMRSPAYAQISREQEISDISRSLKALAKELNLPVIALSQLNRSVESRNDKRPLMSDLRESGAIEQDADLIMFIYREDHYDTNSAVKGIAEIIVSKQRTGPTGVLKLAWSPEFARFDSLVIREDAGELSTEAVNGGFDSDLFDES